MLSAAGAVSQFSQGRTRRNFETDLLPRSAIERQLQSAGETLIRLRRADPESASRIAFSREIIGIRNVVVHSYDQLSESVVWGIVERYVPQLLIELDDLLKGSKAAP